MIITCSTSGVIDSIHKSLTISTTLNERETSLVFQTTTQLSDYETITVKRNDNTVMFSGIVERIKLDNRNGGKIYTVRATGLVKLFDMKRVAKTYLNSTAQEIVEDIIDSFTGGFTHVNVVCDINIKSAQFNHVKPSEAIRQIAESIGYSWYIDNSKDVHFFEKTTNAAPITVVDDEDNYWDLNIEPDTREIANVILVRGGSYLSSTQTYTEVADGEKTQFVLPEKPKDTAIYVNDVLKTSAPQFGESEATTEFQINYNEKYIQNGTHALLNDGDVLRVEYKYDVPLRVQRQDTASVNAIAALFPDTDGKFVKVIEDKTINSRELAFQVIEQNLALYGNAKLNGSFKTREHNIEVGQILTVDVKGYSKDVVVTKVSAKNNGGDLFIYSVQFSTVLFGFEDFLRTLLQRSKIELNDNDVVELLEFRRETLTLSEVVTATVDQNRQSEVVELTDVAYAANNLELEYVHAPYYPTLPSDNKRVFIHDASPHAGAPVYDFIHSDANKFVFSNGNQFTM